MSVEEGKEKRHLCYSGSMKIWTAQRKWLDLFSQRGNIRCYVAMAMIGELRELQPRIHSHNDEITNFFSGFSNASLTKKGKILLSSHTNMRANPKRAKLHQRVMKIATLSECVLNELDLDMA